MTSVDITEVYGKDTVNQGDAPAYVTKFSNWGFKDLTAKSIDLALRSLKNSSLRN